MNSSDMYDFAEDEDYLSPFFRASSDSWQVLAEASAVMILCFTTTTSSLFVIMTLTAGKFEVFDLYLLSLCVSDLLSSVAVVPFSLAAKSGLVTEESGQFACAISGYLHASLCAVRMYTLMWAAVDRYLAIRKLQRYDTIQTRTRCQCWILFSWVMATCLCCPPLLGDSQEHFYHEGFLCLLDITSMLSFSITLGCLVLIPSILTIIYTYLYIFTTITENVDGAKEDFNHSSSYHITTFLVTIEFVILWIPWGIICLFELISGRSLAGPVTRFWMLFLGESYIAWSPLTLLLLCRRCRAGFTALCLKSSTEITV